MGFPLPCPLLQRNCHGHYPPGGSPRPALTAQVVRERAAPPPPPRSLWKRLLLALFVLAFLGSVVLNLVLLVWSALTALEAITASRRNTSPTTARRPTRWPSSPSKASSSRAKTASSSGRSTASSTDKNVKAVVLRVDSPGGSVSGSDYIYHHLRKMRKKRKIPMVVSMGGHRGQRRLLRLDGRRP